MVLLFGSYVLSFDFVGGLVFVGFEFFGLVGGCVVSGMCEMGIGIGGCGSDLLFWFGVCDGGVIDMVGCCEFGSMDLVGVLLDVSGWLGVVLVKVNGVVIDVVFVNLLGFDVGLVIWVEVF